MNSAFVTPVGPRREQCVPELSDPKSTLVIVRALLQLGALQTRFRLGECHVMRWGYFKATSSLVRAREPASRAAVRRGPGGAAAWPARAGVGGSGGPAAMNRSCVLDQ